MDIKNRKHKMVMVDFSNAYLRYFLSNIYLNKHKRRLQKLCGSIPLITSIIKVDEATRSKESGMTSRPLAAVLDIDEVILSNIHMNYYESFYAADYFTDNKGMKWPRSHKLNPLLPWADVFIKCLLDNEINIFFITGRLESIRDETIENFKYVDLTPRFFADDFVNDKSKLIMKPDDSELSVQKYKEKNREIINRNYRIVFNVGDQPTDLGLYGDVQILLHHPFYCIL
jgi:predicted secreted acid phosphatase